MPRVDLTLSVPLSTTVRALQLRGMFDIPEVKLSETRYNFDAPLHERPWQVGLIVGPSGSGKSSIARHLFAGDVFDEYAWPDDVAVIDGFDPALPQEQVCAVLRSVALTDPAVWLRPFRVLSNGEQFCAVLARALLDARHRVVIDEFTSVVSRDIAKIGAQAVAAAVRAVPGKQFVACACHDDLLPWLSPDWIIEPHAACFTWVAAGDASHCTLFDVVIQRERGVVRFDM